MFASSSSDGEKKIDADYIDDDDDSNSNDEDENDDNNDDGNDDDNGGVDDDDDDNGDSGGGGDDDDDDDDDDGGVHNDCDDLRSSDREVRRWTQDPTLRPSLEHAARLQLHRPPPGPLPLPTLPAPRAGLVT